MADNKETPKGFLRDLSRDFKIDFAERERRRWEISVEEGNGLTREEFRQGAIENGLRAKEEFLDKAPVIDADSYDIRPKGLYSRLFGYLIDFAIDRVRRYTPQDYSPQAAATLRVVDRTIVERADIQVCSASICPPNNSIRYINILTRSKEEPEKATNKNLRLPEDSPPEKIDEIFEIFAQKDGRKIIKEIVEEDGQKVEVKILVCDREANFISAEEAEKVISEIETEPFKEMAFPRQYLVSMPPTPPSVRVSLTPTVIDGRLGNIVPSAVNYGGGVLPITT
ncbi:hypothetical protein HZB97_01130, partial [Candidatus Gottesmanbacteria bacterium]|nr:hypothetical protein [Candidatus Gottesmanbacteria bacterium]